MGFTDVAWESRSTEQLARDLTKAPGQGRSARQAWHGCEWQTNWPVPPMNTARSSRRSKPRSPAREQMRRSAKSRSSAAGYRRSASAPRGTANGPRKQPSPIALPLRQCRTYPKPSRNELHVTSWIPWLPTTGRSSTAFRRIGRSGDRQAGRRRQRSCISTRSRVARSRHRGINRFLLDVCNGAALESERHAKDVGEGSGSGGAHGGGGTGGSAVAPMPAPLTPFRAKDVKSSGGSKALQPIGSGAGTSAGSVRVVWAVVMVRWPRLAGVVMATASTNHRYPQQHSATAGKRAQACPIPGHQGLPATGQSDAPFTVSSVSWGPSTSAFDELAAPRTSPERAAYADEP